MYTLHTSKYTICPDTMPTLPRSSHSVIINWWKYAVKRKTSLPTTKDSIFFKVMWPTLVPTPEEVIGFSVQLFSIPTPWRFHLQEHPLKQGRRVSNSPNDVFLLFPHKKLTARKIHCPTNSLSAANPLSPWTFESCGGRLFSFKY